MDRRWQQLQLVELAQRLLRPPKGGASQCLGLLLRLQPHCRSGVQSEQNLLERAPRIVKVYKPPSKCCWTKR